MSGPHTVAIPPSGEAAHVIDGLLYREADPGSITHHTDGGGFSDHVFALAHLLGFRFAPHIPHLAERRLYAFGPASPWPALAPFIAGRVDEKLIVAHWNELLRLATSVRTGAASASLLLKRLGAYPRQNGLAMALREIGRIERTLFMLDWLEMPALRRQATAELNKGEARNALARAVCFHRLGRLLPPARPPARPRRRGAAAPRQRAGAGHCRHRALEHGLSRPRTGCASPSRRDDTGHAAGPPRAGRLAAHQPHRRLPLGHERQPRAGRVQALANQHTSARPRRLMFPLRPAKGESPLSTKDSDGAADLDSAVYGSAQLAADG